VDVNGDLAKPRKTGIDIYNKIEYYKKVKNTLIK